MEGIAIVNGMVVPLEEAGISVLDPGFTQGWAVFEALTAINGIPHNMGAHLDRLEGSCTEACVAMPRRSVLERELSLASSHVNGMSRLRITLTAAEVRVVTARPIDATRRHRPITAARGVYREDPYVQGSVKHCSRLSWMVAVARSAAEEVLLVDGKGRFTEGTTTGIIAVVNGEMWTHPQDGRILESTTVQRMAERARAFGITVHWTAPDAAGPWDGLYVASITRDIAPVTLLDDERLSGWEPIGRRLAGLPVR
ncbi:MAG: branched-subunit amino acid aminotransferase/4-amino-4-deoxychorismate lyase [Kiritimatiellia bacterium]|jgi:branched-subunit amino acid aminotransferase/4-amino-4-deoxychorismate lyase